MNGISEVIVNSKDLQIFLKRYGSICCQYGYALHRDVPLSHFDRIAQIRGHMERQLERHFMREDERR